MDFSFEVHHYMYYITAFIIRFASCSLDDAIYLILGVYMWLGPYFGAYIWLGPSTFRIIFVHKNDKPNYKRNKGKALCFGKYKL